MTMRSLLRAGGPLRGPDAEPGQGPTPGPGNGEGEGGDTGGELLLAYPPGKARYYCRFGVYAKRVQVMWPQVGLVDLVLTWWASRGVLEAWLCRWKAEVVHRLYKQTLGREKSQARSFAAQLMHSELVVRAFHAVREVREAYPGMAWRHARRVAGNRLLTESKATSPPGKRPGKGGGR